jgi:hypothetical protein
LTPKKLESGQLIPQQIIIYLSYFYKHAELTIRLGFFWTALNTADVLSAVIAMGLLNMRGVGGKAGWRWLFLLEVSRTQTKIFGLKKTDTKFPIRRCLLS